MRSQIRVTFIGDCKTGKTTIIKSILCEEFKDKVLPVLPEATLAPSASTEKLPIVLVDTSSEPSNFEKLQQEIPRSDVICLVYDVSSRQTLESLRTTWIPLLKQLSISTPILIIGNKSDLYSPPKDQYKLEMLQLIESFRNIKFAMMCSAVDPNSVKKVLQVAVKIVLYPTERIYDPSTKELKEGCRRAIERIFLLFDSDNNNQLSDEEFQAFQTTCFNCPLSKNDLDSLKSRISAYSTNGIRDNCITFDGFLRVFHFLINLGQGDVVWKILRQFGYADDMTLSEDFLDPPISVQEGAVLELSQVGEKFFSSLFKRFDNDRDGLLSPNELARLFATSPGNPWPALGLDAQTTDTDDGPGLTLEGFMSLWAATTRIDVQKTITYLAYLGFRDERSSAFRVVRGDNEEQTKAQRSVLRVLVFGSSEDSKVALLEDLIDSKIADNASKQTFSVAHPIRNKAAITNNHLILTQFPATQTPKSSDLEEIDAVVLLHSPEDTDSWQYVQRTHGQLAHFISNRTPVLVVEQTDLSGNSPTATRNSVVQQFCKENRLPLWRVCLQQSPDKLDLFFAELFDFASKIPSHSSAWLIAGLVGVSLGLIGASFFAYKYFISNSRLDAVEAPTAPTLH